MLRKPAEPGLSRRVEGEWFYQPKRPRISIHGHMWCYGSIGGLSREKLETMVHGPVKEPRGHKFGWIDAWIEAYNMG